MRLQKCFYCSSTVYPGHGMTFVRNDSRMFTFCRSKCKSHFKKRHNPRKSKWTKAYRKCANKEETFVLNTMSEKLRGACVEKRRNVPIRYNRNLYVKAISLIKTFERIKEKREIRFYLKRMKCSEQKHLGLVERSILKNSQSLKNFISKNLLERSKKVIQNAKTLTPQQIAEGLATQPDLVKLRTVQNEVMEELHDETMEPDDEQLDEQLAVKSAVKSKRAVRDVTERETIVQTY